MKETITNQFFINDDHAVVSSNRVLYTASSFARSSLLHLQEIGQLKALKPHISSRSNLQSYLFFVVFEGEGVLEYNDKKYELSSGSCVFIDCRNQYSHYPKEDDLWRLIWCHFYGPSLPSIYNKYCERGGHPVFTPKDISAILSVLNSLMVTSKSSDYMRDMIINHLLSELLLEVMKESWHPEDKKYAPKRASVLDVKNYLEQHYFERVSLDDLSSSFFIDKYYLAKIFKNQFGFSILSYIQNLRITKAKQLLRFSGKTIEQIGLEVGFENAAYFSRVFKHVEGVSPKQYRNQW